MTYDAIQSISALAGLLLFFGLFAGVLLYVSWPGNRKGFEEASLIPFDKDPAQRGDRND